MSAPQRPTTERILAEILKRTRQQTIGPTVTQLIPAFDGHRSTAFKRIKEMLEEGLIARVPGSKNQYILTPAGLARHARRQGDPS